MKRTEAIDSSADTANDQHTPRKKAKTATEESDPEPPSSSEKEQEGKKTPIKKKGQAYPVKKPRVRKNVSFAPADQIKEFDEEELLMSARELRAEKREERRAKKK